MTQNLAKVAIFGSVCLSSTAYPLGLELEVGASVGKDKQEYETTPEEWNDEAFKELRSFTEKLNNPLAFGGRVDTRLLVIHSRSMHLGIGAGFGYERASSSGTLSLGELGERKVERAYTRVLAEPNVKFTYFIGSSFGVGVGAGYFLGLSGEEEVKGSNETTKTKLKIDNGVRVRATASYVVSNKHQSQIQAGYQLTTAGKFEAEPQKADETQDKFKQSGHSFIVSYIHPIIFGTNTEAEEAQGQSKIKNKPKNGDMKNLRPKKPQPQAQPQQQQQN